MRPKVQKKLIKLREKPPCFGSFADRSSSLFGVLAFSFMKDTSSPFSRLDAFAR